MGEIMKKLLLIILLFTGCIGITDMTILDPIHYPTKVRNGDVVNKYIYDQTYIPLNDMYRRIYGLDYVDVSIVSITGGIIKKKILP
jgi:hypothetical protein